MGSWGKNLTRAVVVALLAGGGCATPPARDVPVEVPVEAPAPRTPETGAPEVPADRPEESTSIQLPRLPVGGDGQPVPGHPGLTCVSVSWIVDPAGPAGLRPGISIQVRGVGFAPEVFRRVRGTCAPDVPDCVGYTFSASSSAPACTVTAWTDVPGASAAVGLRGVVRCRDVESSVCAAFVAGAASESSQLQVTDDRAPEETPSPTPESSGG